jgi:hypothetical protein
MTEVPGFTRRKQPAAALIQMRPQPRDLLFQHTLVGHAASVRRRQVCVNVIY